MSIAILFLMETVSSKKKKFSKYLEFYFEEVSRESLKENILTKD